MIFSVARPRNQQLLVHPHVLAKLHVAGVVLPGAAGRAPVPLRN